jgi:hypothetical protein
MRTQPRRVSARYVSARASLGGQAMRRRGIAERHRAFRTLRLPSTSARRARASRHRPGPCLFRWRPTAVAEPRLQEERLVHPGVGRADALRPPVMSSRDQITPDPCHGAAARAGHGATPRRRSHGRSGSWSRCITAPKPRRRTAVRVRDQIASAGRFIRAAATSATPWRWRVPVMRQPLLRVRRRSLLSRSRPRAWLDQVEPRDEAVVLVRYEPAVLARPARESRGGPPARGRPSVRTWNRRVVEIGAVSHAGDPQDGR